MSTAISGIQFSPTQKSKDGTIGVLTVSFVEGGSHSYPNVSEATYEAFQNAGSQGRFFNEAIRPMDPGSRNWGKKRSVAAKKGWAKSRAKGEYWGSR